MAVAYFDCFAGAGGDMIVGALLDAGADWQELCRTLESLQCEDVAFRQEVVHRHGLAGRKFHVDITPGHQPHRHLSHIHDMIRSASLPPRVEQRACDIFQRLGEAEASVHGTDVESVHFHEVGAADSIADIVGSVMCMELLDIDTIVCSPIPLGHGTIECDHGTMPVPAPATAKLLEGAVTTPGGMAFEMTTPTAAAVLTTLAESYGPPPEMHVRSVGLGAGTRDDGAMPNLLRVFLGDADTGGQADSVVEISANLDDCTGEVLASAMDALREAGCLDAWTTPIYGKKNRPTWMVTVLARPADAGAMEQILFRETPTLGVRRHLCARSKLLREVQTVETPYGPIRIKLGRRDGVLLVAAPEFEDCRTAAEAHGQSVREVLSAAEAAWRHSATS